MSSPLDPLSPYSMPPTSPRPLPAPTTDPNNPPDPISSITPALPPGYVVPPDIEERIAKDADELMDLYFNQLQPTWEEMVRFHNLYFSATEDPRSDEEKLWRSHIFPPRPQIITESKTAVLFDIVTSSDPMIQAEGVEETDEGGKYGERMLGYFQRGMGFRKFLPPFLRNVGIQGTEFNKVYFGKRAHVFDFVPSRSDLDYFEKSILDAQVAHPSVPPPDPMTDPGGFKVWAEIINKAGKVKIPEVPLSGKREVKIYRGPMIDRISAFDVWLDPAEDEIQKQNGVFHRIVQNRRWWLDQAGEDPALPFDLAAVMRALDEKGANWNKYGQRHTTHKQAFYNILNISETSTRDPIYEGAFEGFECYFGTNGVRGEYPYVVLLNGVVINKKPTQMPFMHGMNPIFAARNLAIGGLAHGISDYRPLESVFMENAALRNLRIDGAKLAMIPILAKLASIGTPALLKQLRPGMMVNVPRMDAFGQLFKMTMPEGAWKEPADLQVDMDESSATYGQVRGAPATVGRVSATENSNRFNQAISRLKLCASQIENDMDDFAFQCLALAYQYIDPETRLKVGGPGDPYLNVEQSKILEAMEQDYIFLGAVNAINREAIAQKLNEFGKNYAVNLTPVEMRTIMEEVISAIGVRNAKRIVSPQGTQDAKEAYDIKEQVAKTQAAITLANLKTQAIAPTVPGQIGGDTAQAVGDSAGAPQPGSAEPPAPPAAPPSEGAPE